MASLSSTSQSLQQTDHEIQKKRPDLRHKSDDGTHIIQEGKEELFAKWFHENGGSYPKIEWPSRNTMGQVRGTIATEDIHSNEPMLYVPENIMISPPICKANPLIGHVFTENDGFFKRDDDTMLAVFVMFEKERGLESFWHPYLSVLPWPCSVADWSPLELKELQDRRLGQEATMRPIKLKEKYNTLMDMLLPKYSNLFSKEVHTLEKYVFAWMTIQARAFGRRIPWTALVPFADFLNHTNVQTKYDFNVEHYDGIFRLYPTGENEYKKGTEVFNSYGRRDNRFLLMEYGFALYENEWDTITISINLEEEHRNNSKKLDLLARFNVSNRRSFRLRHGRLNQDMMSMCRLSSMSDYEMDDRRNELRFWSEGVSIVSEIGAQDVYINMLQEALAGYSTTMEEDISILNSEPEDQRLVAATRYRHCKKRILHNHINILKDMRPLMLILLKQEQSNLKTNDPKGLQVNYLEKYLTTIMQISMRGPQDQKGRITEEDLRIQAEEKEKEDELERELMFQEEEERRRQTGNTGQPLSSVDEVPEEHKSRTNETDSEVIVTHPYESSALGRLKANDELARLKRELANAGIDAMKGGLAQGRTVKSGTREME